MSGQASENTLDEGKNKTGERTKKAEQNVNFKKAQWANREEIISVGETYIHRHTKKYLPQLSASIQVNKRHYRGGGI